MIIAALSASAAAAAAAAAAARLKARRRHSEAAGAPAAPALCKHADARYHAEPLGEQAAPDHSDGGDASTVSPTHSDSVAQTSSSEPPSTPLVGVPAASPLPVLSGLWQETVAFFFTSGDIGRLSGCCGALRAELTAEASLSSGGRRVLMVPTLELRVETAEAELSRVSIPHVRALRLWDRLPFNAVASAAARAGSEGFRRLNKFTMKGCHLYPEDVAALLSPSISATPFLKLLNLEKNKVGDLAVQSLCQSGLLQRVDTLNLRFNMIGNAGAVALATCKGARSLRWVNLKMNRVGDEGARALAGLLRDNHSMVLLNLRRQTPALTDSVAFAFAQSLETNGALEALRLRRNKVTDKGASALAAAARQMMLRRCKVRAPWEPLKFELDLEENRLGCPGALALLRCSAAVPARVRLELLVYGNQVSRDELMAAAEGSEEGMDPGDERVWFHSKPESVL